MKIYLTSFLSGKQHSVCVIAIIAAKTFCLFEVSVIRLLRNYLS